MHGVHCYTALQFLELLLDLGTFGLLLVELVLKFSSHTVVSILSLLEIVTDLMDVSQGVQVLVLVKRLISLLLVVAIVARLHQDDLALGFLVGLLQLLVLSTLILDSLDQLSLHGWLRGQVTDSAIVLFVRVLAVLGETIVRL